MAFSRLFCLIMRRVLRRMSAGTGASPYPGIANEDLLGHLERGNRPEHSATSPKTWRKSVLVDCARARCKIFTNVPAFPDAPLADPETLKTWKAAMNVCWVIEADDRPTFEELYHLFRRLLQKQENWPSFPLRPNGACLCEHSVQESGLPLEDMADSINSENQESQKQECEIDVHQEFSEPESEEEVETIV